MGFLDKAAKAAGQAKGQIDQVRAARNEAAGQPVNRALDEHQTQALQRARALGAPDPFALVTAEEVSAIMGVPMGSAGLAWNEDTIGPMFEASGRGTQLWRVSVYLYHATEHGAFDAQSYWNEYVGGMLEDAAQVDELGDRALFDGSILWVMYGPLVFYIEVTTPEGYAHPQEAAQIAQRVLERLSQLR